MATIIDSGLLTITIGAVVVDCVTGCTFTSTNDEIETTCQNATASKSYRAGANEWSISLNQNNSFDGSGMLFKTLLTTHQARTEVAVEFVVDDGTGFKITGNCSIPSATLTGGNSGANFTGDWTLKGSGPYTIV